MHSIMFRPTLFIDIDPILALANQKDVRANSFSHKKISKKENREYWKRKLVSPDFLSLSGFDGNKLVCIARLDGETVSIAVDQEYRKKGIAFKCLSHLDLSGCTAEVMPGNAGSIRLFEKLGFRVSERLGNKLVMRKPGRNPNGE